VLALIEKTTAAGEAQETLTLPYDLRQKSRQRVRLDSGRAAAVLLAPGTVLDDGDRLRAADGTAVRVRAATETVSIARSHDALRLARACYHLGNRHVRLQVGTGWVRYQPDHVLDQMVRGLGLDVSREAACFEPERGAYGGHRHHQDDDSAAAPHAHRDGHHH